MRSQISRIEAISVIAQARTALWESEKVREYLDDWAAADLESALSSEFSGVSNGFLSQAVEILCGDKLEVVGEPEILFRCPCCDRRTLTERYDANAGTGYDICDYCRWEDDGTIDASEERSINRGSMNQYRERIHASENYYFREKWLR